MTPMRYMLYLFLGYRYYIALAVVGVVCWLVARRRGVLAVKSRTLAASAPKSNWASRAAESIVLLCILLAFVPVMHRMGLSNYLRESPPGVVRVHTIFMVCLYVAAFGAALACFFWKTSAGFVVGLGLCAVSFFYGTLWFNPLRIPGIEDARSCEVPYTFNVNYSLFGANNSLTGADIWVNDVHLGKSPLKTTLNEFLAKVPYWAEAPEPNESAKQTTLSYDSYSSSGTSTLYRWIKFVVPEMPQPDEFSYPASSRKMGESIQDWRETADRARSRRAKETEAQRTYYARIDFGSAPGYGHSPGGGFRSSSRGGIRRYSGRRRFDVYFPLMDQRIDSLLDQARAVDYEVGPEWLVAMSSYGGYGWELLRKAAYCRWLASGRQYYETKGMAPIASEPGMIEVMDALASKRFGLDGVKSGRDAWDALQSLCRQADTERRYSTDSIEGHAVGLLMSEVDKKQFARWAVRRAKSRAFHYVAFRSFHDFGHFEWSESDSDPGVRPSDYLAADAIRRMDRLLDEEGDGQYNIVEREVARAMILWQDPLDYAVYRFAAFIDGPELGSFFERFWIESQRTTKRRIRSGFSTSGLEGVNLWLHLMANVQGQVGQALRAKYDDEILEMTAKIAEDEGLVHGQLDFLALDLETGRENLGVRLWPQYREIVQGRNKRVGYGPLYTMWRYLVLIEPAARPEMFVECWRESVDRRHEFYDALKLIDFMPEEKARAVLSSLSVEVQERPENIRKSDSDEPDAFRAKRILEHIDKKLAMLTEGGFAEYIVEELRDSGPMWRERIPKWLEEMRPGHVVGEKLAASEDAGLRKMAVRLVEAHPTARNREVLRGLLDDTDDEVRGMAESAVEGLKRLSEMSPGKLAADAPVVSR